MLAVLKAEHLDVAHPDGASRRLDVARRAVQHTLVRACKRTFLDRDLAGDVEAVHIDMRIWEGEEPAAKELNAGRLPLAPQSPWRLEGGIVREHFRKPIHLMSIEGFRSPRKRLAHRHCH